RRAGFPTSHLSSYKSTHFDRSALVGTGEFGEGMDATRLSSLIRRRLWHLGRPYKQRGSQKTPSQKDEKSAYLLRPPLPALASQGGPRPECLNIGRFCYNVFRQPHVLLTIN